MATIPISDAIVSVLANNISIGNAISDFNGKYSYTWSVTEDEYNSITDVAAQASKPGYLSGANRVTPLPSLTSAIENGISINVVLEKESQNPQFFLNKYSVYFNSSGGNSPIIVTCPDNTWVVEESSSWITATKIDASNLNIVATAQPVSATTKRITTVTVRWGETRLVINCEQNASTAVTSDITFKGRITDIDTGAGVAGITVNVNGNIWVFSGPDTQTDSSGYYSMTEKITEEDWNRFVGSIYTTENATYSGNTKQIVNPTYTQAVQNGVTTNLTVQNISGSTFSITPTDHSFSGSGGTKSFIITKLPTDNVTLAPGIEAAWAAKFSEPTGQDKNSVLSYQLVDVDATTIRLDITLTQWAVGVDYIIPLPGQLPPTIEIPPKRFSWTVNSGRADGLSVSFSIAQVASQFAKLQTDPRVVQFKAKSDGTTEGDLKEYVNVMGIGDRSWTASTSSSFLSLSDFSDPDSSFASATGRFAITCQPNTSLRVRSDQVAVRTTSGIIESVVVNVTQEPAELIIDPGSGITASPSSLTWLNSEFGSQNAKTTTVSPNTNWYHQLIGDTDFNFSVSRTSNGLSIYPLYRMTTGRTGSIRVYSGENEAFINLTYLAEQ